MSKKNNESESTWQVKHHCGFVDNFVNTEKIYDRSRVSIAQSIKPGCFFFLPLSSDCRRNRFNLHAKNTRALCYRYRFYHRFNISCGICVVMWGPPHIQQKFPVLDYCTRLFPATSNFVIVQPYEVWIPIRNYTYHYVHIYLNGFIVDRECKVWI